MTGIRPPITSLAPLLAALAATTARADLIPPVQQQGQQQSQPRAEQPVRLTVQVIRASSAPGESDPRLAPLQKRLSDFKFASYKLVSEKPVALARLARESLGLPGGRRLEVAEASKPTDPPQKVRLHLKLTNERQASLLDADYLINRGGDLLVGGPRLEDGTLLLFIRH